MSATRRVPKGRRRQRGAVLAVAGVAMILLVGMAVLGVDVGHLAFTANEVQALADLSATSYVKTLADNQDDGGSRDPVAETNVVVQENSVGGTQATVAENIASFEPGNYDTVTRQFTAGATPVNAVKATAVATVPNFFAGIFGVPESTVTREATAALTPPGRAPVLPLALGECWWDIFQNTGDCEENPQFTLGPDPAENSCWTSLQEGSASTDTIRELARIYCGLDSGSAAAVGVGDSIQLTNGKLTPVLRAVQACLDAGFDEFLVPVISCREGQDCTQSEPVQGFATIKVTQVVDTGAAASTGIYAASVCSTDPPGASTGGTVDTGTTVISMVK
jgi:hypothetical protein